MSTPHLQIKSNDVLQLILQYLHQNKLFKSYNILSEQANLTLNQINKKDFIEAFNKQNWSQILISVESLMLTPQILFNLYQFICDSLIQRQQFVAASFLIQQLILANIKDISPFRERLLRLEYIIQHPNQKNLYKNPPNEQRRLSVLNKVLQNCCQTQPQRLLKLLSQAIKYQVSQGVINPTIKIDMFTGLQEQIKSEAQTTIKQVEKTIQYNQQSKITAIKLSWNDEILAIGGVDGLIELYNTKDYALCDTEYQRQGVMLFHQNPISLMEFNYQDQMLASVDSQALVNIWNLKNGKLLRKIDKEERINAICWGIDPSHFLVGYQDRIKLYGVRSCNVLKQYSTNKQEYLQKIMVSDSRLYALSSNCTFKMFNYATQEQLFSLELKQSLTSSFCIFKNDVTHIFKSLIVSGKNKIYEFDQNGIQKAKYIVDDGEIQNCYSVGYFIYINVKGVDNKYRLSVLDRQKKKTVYYVSVQSPFQQMAMTRRRNLMITYDQSHKLSFWRP